MFQLKQSLFWGWYQVSQFFYVIYLVRHTFAAKWRAVSHVTTVCKLTFTPASVSKNWTAAVELASAARCSACRPMLSWRLISALYQTQWQCLQHETLAWILPIHLTAIFQKTRVSQLLLQFSISIHCYPERLSWDRRKLFILDKDQWKLRIKVTTGYDFYAKSPLKWCACVKYLANVINVKSYKGHYRNPNRTTTHAVGIKQGVMQWTHMLLLNQNFSNVHISGSECIHQGCCATAVSLIRLIRTTYQ